MKEIREKIHKLIDNSDIKELKRVCANFSYYTLVSYLEENQTVKKIARNPDIKFAKEVLDFTQLVSEIENVRYPFSVDEGWIYYKRFDNINGSKFQPSPPQRVQNFKEMKAKKANELKDKLLIYTINSIREDNLDFLPRLQLYWNKRNTNHLANKCGAKKLIKIIDIMMDDLKKEKTKRHYPGVNRNYFLKNIFKHADIDLLEYLVDKYPREIKNAHHYLSTHNQFWLFHVPKSNENKSYCQDKETYSINFDFEKLMWFEKNNLGLKQNNYKNIDLFLPLMSLEQINTYTALDKPNIGKSIQDSLLLRLEDNNWQKANYQFINENPGTSQYDRISKYILYHNLSQDLDRKEENKKNKI